MMKDQCTPAGAWENLPGILSQPMPMEDRQERGG